MIAPYSLKFLCCCAGGNSRSHALAFLLKNYWRQQAIAVGLATGMSAETLDMLFRWADKIVVLDEQLRNHVPEDYRHKELVLDVGEDKYFMGMNDDLARQLVAYLDEYKFLFGEVVPEYIETVQKWRLGRVYRVAEREGWE